jgi:hypothetical protein
MFSGRSAAGGLLLRLVLPEAFDFGILRPWSVLVLAGVLVGYGTRSAMDARAVTAYVA